MSHTSFLEPEWSKIKSNFKWQIIIKLKNKIKMSSGTRYPGWISDAWHPFGWAQCTIFLVLEPPLLLALWSPNLNWQIFLGSNANYDRWLRDSVILSLSIKFYVNIQVLFCLTFVPILDWMTRGWFCLSHLCTILMSHSDIVEVIIFFKPSHWAQCSCHIFAVRISHPDQKLQLFRTCWIPVIRVIWMNLVDMVDLVDLANLVMLVILVSDIGDSGESADFRESA